MPGLTLPPSQQINMDTSLGPNHNRRGGNAISDIIFDSRSSYQPSANHYPQYPYRSSSPPQTQPQPQPQPQPQLAYYYHPQQQRMFSYFALPPQGPNSWNASGPIIQPMHIPPPPPQPPTRPPRSQHKVWILDCKGCETFLTNRGMKAVLLLRTEVSLYSTDALPINCSAYSAGPLRAAPTPATTSVQARTCECLTQTLCCHGCGNAVGYMIVIPCSRCTNSTTTTNRATNGHRFVFHSAEVKASERHYIPDEPGITPEESIPVQCNSSRATSPLFSDRTSSLPNSPSPSSSHASLPTSTYLDSSSSGESGLSDSDEPPSLVSSSSSLSSMDELHLPRLLNPSNPRARTHSPPIPSVAPMPSSLYLHPPAAQSIVASHVQKEEAVEKRKLRAGDVVYWHHMVRGGEIPGVCEDARARVGRPGASSRGSAPIRRKGDQVREEKEVDHGVRGAPAEDTREGDIVVGMVVAGR